MSFCSRFQYMLYRYKTSVLLFFAGISLSCFSQLVPHITWAQESRTAVSSVWWQTVNVHVVDRPIRDVLDDFAKKYKIGVVLDRRVNPGIPVSVTAVQLPLDTVLENLAENTHLSYCTIGDIVYMGPPHEAGMLLAILYRQQQRIDILEPTAAKRFARPIAVRTKFLDTPQEVLESILRNTGLSWFSLDRVPHDLLPAYNLPNTAVATLASLFLLPFEMTFQISQDATMLMPAPLSSTWNMRRTYIDRDVIAVETFRQRYPELAAKFLFSPQPQPLPKMEKVAVAILEVSGTLVDVARLEEFVWLEWRKQDRIVATDIAKVQNDGTPNDVDLTQRRFDFKVVAIPVTEILKTVAAQTNLQLEMDEDGLKRANIDLTQRVTLDLKKATVMDIFRRALQPLGATFEIDGNILRIRSIRSTPILK